MIPFYKIFTDGGKIDFKNEFKAKNINLFLLNTDKKIFLIT